MSEPVDQVYAPPSAPLPQPEPRRGRRAQRWRNGLVVAALGIHALGFFSPGLMLVTYPFTFAMLIAAAVAAGIAARLNGRTPWIVARDVVATLFGWFAVHSGLTVGAVIVAEYLGNGFRRGRQVRERGALVLAPLGQSSAWQTLPTVCQVDLETRDALADQWRDNGLTEHASVIAFAKLSLELMELGAPSELVIAAQNDGLDESRHTEMCFSLAHAIDGRSIGPEGFPKIQRSQAAGRSRLERLQRLAVDSLFDGVIHEGVSARIVAKLAKGCTVPAIHEVLTNIARDEGRHAAHAADVLEWCISEGGHHVAEAVRGALATIPTQLDHTTSAAAARGEWESYGIAGNAFADGCYAETLDNVRRRYGNAAAA